MIRAFNDLRTVTQVYCVTKDENNNYRLEVMKTAPDVKEDQHYRVVCDIQEATSKFIGVEPSWALPFRLMKSLAECHGPNNPGLDDASYEAICRTFGKEPHDTLTEALEEFLGKDGIQQRGSGNGNDR